jgi:carbon storage regulator
MLILNRKAGESIILDDNIEIKILDVKDGKIKIGIEAPADVYILRKEVYEEIKNQNKRSLESQIDIVEFLSNGK